MYRLRFSVFTAACLLIIAGMLMVSCSDDDKASNPVIPPTLEGEWAPLGSEIGIGASGQAYALTVFGDDLILGGIFSDVDSVAANNVAAWDGSSWAPLGAGISGGPVRVFTTFMAVLLAGGGFDHAGDVSADNVALWDGSSWGALGTGRDQVVFALAAYEDVILAGGEAGANGGLSIMFLSGQWQTLDPTMYVFAFATFNNELIIGGSFSTIGTDSVNNIAALESNFTPLGTGIGGTVYALAVYQGKLIAGGSFTSAGGASVSNIAAWNGLTWTPLGEGVNGTVKGLTVFNNILIAGGSFTTAGGNNIRYIAAWDGSSWKALGSGVDGAVTAVGSYDNKLIAGGDFNTAGGVSARGIAAWTPQ